MRLVRPHKKQRFAISLALFFIWGMNAAVAQWQQEVNYRINVNLNDKTHMLTGDISIKYVNNSPSALDFIWFHLWPNAYRNNKTALAKQLLRRGETKLHYAPEEQLGYIDSLSFALNGKAATFDQDPENADICKVKLNELLKPGESVTITTPFRVKIPDARFSRLGHTGQSYFITQWYPKPAVYDRYGWHPMPYLDQGEFYSEFGSFDVSITLPSNYMLAATGDRAPDEKESAFIAGREKITRSVLDTLSARPVFQVTVAGVPEKISSSTELKTVRFTQNNVHDFAWFADKRYLAVTDTAVLGSGKKVSVHTFFTPGNMRYWKDAASYVKDAVEFYSRRVGEYPYNHATAVDGTIMAGGGMEYPNITVIGNVGGVTELDMVIAHEVGHNWFYGMLGSNERDAAYLDEGLNAFYESRYLREKYPTATLARMIQRDSTFTLFGVNKVPMWQYYAMIYRIAQRKRSDQPLNVRSQDYSSTNYGSVVYAKSALLFDYLLQVNGPRLDTAIKNYFREFKFRHPDTSDLRTTLINHGVLNAEVYRDLFTTTLSPDYSIGKIKRNGDSTYAVTLKNKGPIASPLLLAAFEGKTRKKELVVEGFTGRRTVTLSVKANRMIIDPDQRMPEISVRNNTSRTRGMFRKAEPLKLKALSAIEKTGESHLYYSPVIGGNYYNGWMAGVALHNYGIFQKRLEWYAVPMFAFRSASPAGVAGAEIHFYPGTAFSNVTAGIRARSFALYDASLLTEAGSFSHFYRADV